MLGILSWSVYHKNWLLVTKILGARSQTAGPLITLGLGAAAVLSGAAISYLTVGLERSVLIFLIVSTPAIVISAVKPHWFLTMLYVGSGTALAGAFLGRENLIQSLGGLNSFSLAMLMAFMAMSTTVLVRLRKVRYIIKGIRWHLLLVCFAGLSLFWGPYLLIGIREWVKLLFPLLSLITAYIVWRNHPRPVMLKAMLWAGVIIVVAGPVLFFLGNPGVVYWSSNKPLYSGSWGVSSFEFGAFVGLLSIYTVVEYHFTRKKWFLFLSMLFVLSTFATQVRSVIFPLFIVAGIYLLLTSRSPLRFFYPVLGALVLLIATTSIQFLKDRTFGTYSENISVTTILVAPERLLTTRVIRFSRGPVWRAALELLNRSPVIGGGLGVARGGGTGSEYIGILADTGLIGLGLYMLALVSYAIAMWQSYRRSRTISSRKYGLLGLLWLLYFMGYSFAYDAFDTLSIVFLTFSMLGIAFAARHNGDEIAVNQVGNWNPPINGYLLMPQRTPEDS